MNLFALFSRGGHDASVVGHEEFAAVVGDRSCHIVDVREPDEFAGGHVPGAINRPLSRFDPRSLPSSKPVVLVCKAGSRSANALRQALAAGREDVRHYAGGTMGWRSRGGAMES